MAIKGAAIQFAKAGLRQILHTRENRYDFSRFSTYKFDKPLYNEHLFEPLFVLCVVREQL